MFWKQQVNTLSCAQTNNVQTNHNSNYNSKLTNGFHPIPKELVQLSAQTTQKQNNIPSSQTCNNSPLKLSGNSTQISQESDEYLDSRSLPPNFEKNIRELEVIIEETPEIELEKIKELIMLYTLAVEYYDSNNDDKFIYYKNKIVHLHQQANVIKAMNKHIAPRSQLKKVKSPVKGQFLDLQKIENIHQYTSDPSIPNIFDDNQPQLLEREKEKKQIETKEKMKGFEEKAVVGITDADVNKILDIQDENVIEQEIIIEKDLKKQTNNILKRLNKRMKTKVQCSTPPSSSSSKKHDFKIDLCFTEYGECSNFGAGVEESISKAQVKQPMTSRQQRQKPSFSVIDSIVTNFITDKKRSLTEEKNFKIDQIEFEYEKLSFQLEKSKTILTEEELKKLESEKDNKIRLIEEDFIKKEKQEIEIIHQKYYYKYDLHKSKDGSPIKSKGTLNQDSEVQISNVQSNTNDKSPFNAKYVTFK